MKKIYLLAAITMMTQLSFGAELFIRVMRSGTYVATAYNQTQSNPTNIFRFFDLPSGNTNVQITDQQYGHCAFSGYVNIGANQRVVAEVDYNGNLQIIQIIAISNTNWYTTNPGNVYNPNPYPNNGYPNNGDHQHHDHDHPHHGNGQWNGADPTAFAQFLQLMDEESFDSNKLTLANSYASKTNLSAQQIADVSRKFTYDSSRLDWAKSAYAGCYDKANYFLLKGTFSYSSTYSALEEYIEGQ